jgi:DNA primase
LNKTQRSAVCRRPRPQRFNKQGQLRNSRPHSIDLTPSNLLAWEFFTTPTNIGVAEAYLRDARGIDVGPLCAAAGGEPIVGHAKARWRGLTRHLLGQGASEDELLELDLAQRSRNGQLIDTYRGRLIMPVLRDRERIDGFMGRDTTGDPKAPKYRNPTRTPTFDKSTAIYRPTHHALDGDATVVVVEGALDALAIAASSARTGELSMFAPVTTSGVTVSGVQARAVLALYPKPPVIALDGDPAGRKGTDRWLQAICIERGRPALITPLPNGVDPADWLREQGDTGLRAFDRRGCIEVNTNTNTNSNADAPRPALPGRDLVRICVDQPGKGSRRVLDVLVPLALRLPEGAARALIDQAGHEMTKRGWNPRGEFVQSAHFAISRAQGQARAGTEGQSRLSTEVPRRDAHQVA